jgi:hypothetical protein
VHLSSHAPEEASELAFYARALQLLNADGVPYLVGGACALRHYCGIARETKDLDIFVRERDVERTLVAFERAGYATQTPFPHWLAKVLDGPRFLDIIFNSGNGASPVDDVWLAHAESMRLFGQQVQVCPVEETIWSKAFVMERERFDGADVAHLIAHCARAIDWDRLLVRFGENWPVLLSHLVIFIYAFPTRAHDVPQPVLDELLARTREARTAATAGTAASAASAASEGSAPVPEELCRGTLLSREQYLVDVERGMRDGRLPPTGSMTPDEIATWTDAIPLH